MSPEELNRLASKEFSEILAADPVIKDLRASLTNRKDAVPTAFDALLMSGGDRIGNLPVLPLTAAKWTFLWICGNPFVSSGNKVSEEDVNIFLFVLACPDLRKLDFPVTRLAAKARDYSAATGLDIQQVIREIQTVVNTAFSALSMLPRAENGDSGEALFDSAWLAWIASIAVRESGMPYDRVIHELPLSLVCNFYVSWRRRESIDGDKIHRPQNGEILDRINARIEELGKAFLNGPAAASAPASSVPIRTTP